MQSDEETLESPEQIEPFKQLQEIQYSHPFALFKGLECVESSVSSGSTGSSPTYSEGFVKTREVHGSPLLVC